MNQLVSIYPLPLLLGEGPIWDERLQVLYFVDIFNKKLYQWHYQGEKTAVFSFDEYISCIALGMHPGYIYIALESGIYRFDLLNQSTTFLSQPESKPNYRYNDGRVDIHGNWLLGSMNNINNGPEATLQPDAKLYRVTGQRDTSLLDQVTISNGIAFYDDWLYYIDSKLNTIRKFHYDGDTLRDSRVIFNIEDGSTLDGMCISKNKKLYIANWGGAQILVFDLSLESLEQSIPLPALNPSSCALGGPLLNELFITTSQIGDANENLSGVYRIKVNDTGFIEHKFNPSSSL